MRSRYSNILAAALFLFAIGALLIRWSLPNIQGYGAEIEHTISHLIGRPVTVEAITADWHGWYPQLHLIGLDLPDPDYSRHPIRFERVSLRIAPLATLLAGELRLNRANFAGLQLTVRRKADGSIHIDGTDPDNNNFIVWLLKQPQASFDAGQVVWVDEQAGRPPMTLTEVSLHLRNEGGQHQLQGEAQPPANIGKELRVAFNVTGNPLASSSSGNFYAAGEEIKPALLFKPGLQLPLELRDGKGNFRVWSDLNPGKPARWTGDFSVAHLDSATGNNLLNVKEARGRFALRPVPEVGWRIDLDDFSLTTQNGAWPPARLSLVLGNPGPDNRRVLAGHMSLLRFEDICPLLTCLHLLPPGADAVLEGISPKGEIRDVLLGYFPKEAGSPRFFLRTSFRDITTKPAVGMPGVQGLTGTLEAGTAGGIVQLAGTTPLQLEFPNLFEAPLSFEKLSGDIQWNQTEKGWRVHTPLVEIINRDIKAKLSGGFEWAPEQSPFMDLLIQFQEGRLESFGHYVPRMLPDKAYQWLTRAFQGGIARSGSAVLRGPINRFPFDQHEGRFAVHVEADDAALKYASQWPPIHDIDAQVAIEGRVLNVQAENAKILEDIAVKEVIARIPDLGSKDTHVLVHGLAQSPATEARQFVMKSPLKEKVGKRIEHLVIGGDVTLDLTLDIALSPETNRVDGKLTFPGNPMSREGMDIAFADLSGMLRFGIDDWSAEGMKAKLLGQPVRIDLKGGEKETWARIQGRADRTYISELLQEFGPKDTDSLAHWFNSSKSVDPLIEGETTWQAHIDLSKPWDHPEAKDNVRISSNLAGLKLNAPAPLGKEKDAVRDFVLKTSFSPAPSGRSFTISYGNLVSAELRLAKGPSASPLDRAIIRLGQRQTKPPLSTTFWVGGDLAKFSLSEWQDFSQHHPVAALTALASEPRTEPSTGVDVRLAEMEAFGYTFKDLRLTIPAKPDPWSVRLQGKDASGVIQVQRNKAQLTINAELQRLKLVKTVDNRGALDMDPTKVPALSVYCRRLTLGSADLGEAIVKIHPVTQGLRFDKIAFTSPASQINASGDWKLTQGAQRSQFNIQVEGPELGRLLERFGYQSAALEGGKTQMEIHAAWPGSLATLHGSPFWFSPLPVPHFDSRNAPKAFKALALPPGY